MKILRILSGLLVFLLLPGCTSASVQKNDEPYTAQIFAMDTIMNLTIYGEHGQEMSRRWGPNQTDHPGEWVSSPRREVDTLEF